MSDPNNEHDDGHGDGGDADADATKVRCPKCGAAVKVDAAAQKAMKTTCPKGHTIELVKAI